MKFLGHFSRVTTPGRVFLPHVDGLRFIAIMVVIFYHALGFYAFHVGLSLAEPAVAHNLFIRFISAGHLGVDLFFVISGFILSVPFAQHALQQKPAVRLGGYYMRRLTRLEPPYIINLVFCFFLCALVLRHFPAHAAIYHNPHWLGYVVTHLLASLVYSNGFIYGVHPFPNLVLWTLEVEVEFYLLMPIFARLFLIRPTWLRRVVLLALIGLDIFVVSRFAPYWVWASLIGNVSYFFVGLLICDFYLLDWAPRERHYAADVLFVLSGIAIPLVEPTAYVGLLLPWLLLIFVGSSFRGRLCNRMLSWPLVATIGGMCYTIYLYHFLLLSFLIRLTAPVQTHRFAIDLPLQMVLLSVLILAISAVLFVFLERPFMQRDWPGRFATWIRARRPAKITAA